MIPPDIRNDSSVRGFLEHFEDEILMHILSRAQFAANPEVYKRGYNGNRYMSLLDKMLLVLERDFSTFGRYKDPIERPFNVGLPPPEDERVIEHPDIHLANYDSVNVTRHVMEEYLKLVPSICPAGDNIMYYGSSAEHDIPVLMTVSQRVHSGIYVAEWKRFKKPEKFDRLIAKRERKSLLEAITESAVEDDVLQRVNKKAIAWQSEINPEVRTIVPFEVIVNFYKDAIIPLTKEVQVRYFLNRVGIG